MKHVFSHELMQNAAKVVRSGDYSLASKYGMKPLYSSGNFTELLAADVHNPDLVVKVSPITDPWWLYAEMILEGRIKSVAAPVIHGQVKIGNQVITTMERLHTLRSTNPNTQKSKSGFKYGKKLDRRMLYWAAKYVDRGTYCRELLYKNPPRVMRKYGLTELTRLCDCLWQTAEAIGIFKDYHGGNFMVRRSDKQLVCIDPWYAPDDFGRGDAKGVANCTYGV